MGGINSNIGNSIDSGDHLKEQKDGYFKPKIEAEALFPYDDVRNEQRGMVIDIYNALKKKRSIVAHAPTGLGKTAAALAPALKFAIDNNKTIFFLTSRHTQHKIAIDTLRAIKEKHAASGALAIKSSDNNGGQNSEDLVVVDLIGKQWMCAVPGVETLFSTDFTEYCRKQCEEGRCDFYNNTKKGQNPTAEAKIALKNLKRQSPEYIESFKEFCVDEKLCPYEMAAIQAKDAKVIIADYYYIFNPFIMQRFFQRAELDLEDVVVIVDEAHNLPDRIRNLMTKNLSSTHIGRGMKEADKHSLDEVMVVLNSLKKVLDDVGEDLNKGSEKLVGKNQFISKIAKYVDYDEAIQTLEEAAALVRDADKKSILGAIADFLQTWLGKDEGYVRLAQKKEKTEGKYEQYVVVSYRCLDPSMITKDVIEKSHSTIMMSGTLTPTNMYRDLIGMPKTDNVSIDSGALERVYLSPFPKKNKLTMIVPETTTKFTMRTDAQFTRIGEICAEITNEVKGNSAVFFPSYHLRDKCQAAFSEDSTRTCFMEDSSLTKAEKEDFLNRFKQYKKTGAVLLGVMGGNFSEGVDLPGDLLKCVVVVGLPLQKPDLESSKLIEYYDKKFGRGWDYGYLFPAFNKTLQAAGRCIRSETDKGVVVFLDERYAWPNYSRCFPPDSGVRITKRYVDKIRDFFNSFD